MRVYADESETTKANFLSKHHQLRRQGFARNFVCSVADEYDFCRLLRSSMSYLNLLLGRLHMLARAVVVDEAALRSPQTIRRK